MFDAAAAIAFVDRRGDAIGRSRLHAILGGVAPDPAAIAAALVGQRDDGGWASPRAGAPAREVSSIAATCERLRLAEQLGLVPPAPDTSPGGVPAGAEQVARALRFLVTKQRADGTWFEEPPLASSAVDSGAGWWLDLTARCGYWLALGGPMGGPGVAEAAMDSADRLEREAAENGGLPGAPDAQWSAAGLLLRLGRHVAAERMLDYLRVWLLPGLDAGRLAALVAALAAAGVPPAHPTVRAAIPRLAALQRAGGGWSGGTRGAAAAGSAGDVETTLAALRSLRWYARGRAAGEIGSSARGGRA